MRIAIVGANAPHRSEDAWARAARSLGHNAEVFDVLRWTRRLGRLSIPFLVGSIERYQPDFLLFTRHATRLGTDSLRSIVAGRRSAVWYLDAETYPELIELARISGTLYLTSPDLIGPCRNQGIPAVRFLPQGVDPDNDFPSPVHRPGDRCDVSFVGSGQYPHRWPILAAVAEVAALQIRGPGWEGAPPGLPVAGGPVHGEVIAGAAVSLGANALPSQDHGLASASNRMWKVLGCGGAYLGRHVDGIQTLARHEEHCCWYRSIDDALEQLRALLDDPDRRRAMAERGRRHALAHHTYASRLSLLLAGEEFPI
ncbi:MAG TPA: glycosyltransferase [Gemmatimonadales bacterium]|nr:glycosyltransferase [Gemmatimonadales bacterium]